MKLERASQAVVVLITIAILGISTPSPALADSKRHVKAVLRRPSTGDLDRLTALMMKLHSTAKLTEIGIVRNFALVAWPNGPVGGEFLATDSSGRWMLVAHDHGSFTPSDLVAAAPALDAEAAHRLVESVGSQQGSRRRWSRSHIRAR